MEIIQYSKVPVIATHTFCKALYNHPRGKSDEEIKYLAKKGGMVGILINPSFFTRHFGFSVSDFLDHIDHAIKIAGIKHVGIGTDWDTTLPALLRDYLTKLNLYSRWYDWRKETKGYRDQRDWINIIKGLISRGYKENEIKAIIGENFLRIFKEVVG
jgi:membrane dipeptidase